MRIGPILRLLPLLLATVAVPAAAQIPASTGWFQVPNTRIRPLCPAGIPGVIGCEGVTAAWSSGVFDQARNRLIIWGGGHTDYSGNELYAVDLSTLSSSRLTNPGPPATSCVETLSDGTPNSRHTYAQITFIDHTDEMYSFSGSIACPSSGINNTTWVFNFTAMRWTRLTPGGTLPPATEGGVTAYDPVGRNVYLHTPSDGHTYRYDRTANMYARITTGPDPFPFYGTGVIDPRRRRFVIVGGGQAKSLDITLSSTRLSPLSLSGCSGLMSAPGPGLAYVPPLDRIVGWAGGNTVYIINLDTNSCTTQSFTGGPSRVISDTWDNGTFGRWRYSQASQVFVYYGDVDSDAVTLRISANSGPAPNTPTSVTLR